MHRSQRKSESPSLRRSPGSRNSTPPGAISVTSTRSIRYRNTPKTNNINEMKKNVIACLDDSNQKVLNSSIFLFITWSSDYSRYANRSARFISGYDLGLSGAEAAWVNKRYHGHRTLPPIMLAKVQQAQINMPAVAHKIFFHFQNFSKISTRRFGRLVICLHKVPDLRDTYLTETVETAVQTPESLPTSILLPLVQNGKNHFRLNSLLQLQKEIALLLSQKLNWKLPIRRKSSPPMH